MGLVKENDYYGEPLLVHINLCLYLFIKGITDTQT